MSRTSGIHLGMSGVIAGLIEGKPRPHLERIPLWEGACPDEASGFTTKFQSNMNSASLLNCASNRFAGIGRPNR